MKIWILFLTSNLKYLKRSVFLRVLLYNITNITVIYELVKIKSFPIHPILRYYIIFIK